MVNNFPVYASQNFPHSVHVLLLIENSGGVFSIWPDLRDRYLGPLLQKIEHDYPSVPVTTFVLESLPPNSTQHRKPIVPRQYRTCHDGLLDVRFNHSASNRLTYSKIQEAAKFITSATDSNDTIQRHIVIAAASPPLEERTTESGSGYPAGMSCWYRLAEYLAKADVRCHLLLKSGQDWEGLTNLFEEMLRLQQITEEKPWFPVDMQKITVRLSSQRKSSQKDNKTQESGHSKPTQLPPTPANKTTAADSFPPYPISPTAISTTSATSTPGSPTQSPQEPLPSLVSHLQQVHGLTKKKVYGVKPTRKPFVSGEAYHGDPVNRKSLSISPESSPMNSNHGGKAPSPSTFDRSTRRYTGSSPDLRPYPKSRGSFDTATAASYTPTQIYDPSWLRRDSGSSITSGGSVSLPGSPPPQYVSLTHAPPDYTQPELPWSSASASPVAVTPNSSPYEFSSAVSSKFPLPPTPVSHPSHHTSHPSSIAMAPYPQGPHSPVGEQFPLPPHQHQQSPFGGSHFQPEGITHSSHLGHYNVQAMNSFLPPPTSTTTMDGEERSETETDMSNKNPGTMGWDPDVYRNELLSHLAGPTTTAHYVPSTMSAYGTPPHETTVTFNKGIFHSAGDLERPSGTGTSPQTLYPYEDWQSRESQFNNQTYSQYSSSSASYPSKNSRVPPGSNSLTNWAG